MGKRVIIKGANFAINAIDRISPSTTYYSVIYNLSHCSASNSATSIAAGSTYTVTITANSGYNISSVSVKHNGQTVNPTGSGYTYTINNVSGNITVTATATAVVTNYTVTYDLVNATASNNTTTVAEGSSYTVTLTPNSGYTISSATVTHNRVEVTPTSGYTYEIPSVSGNILVECVAVEQTADITWMFNFTDEQMTNQTQAMSSDNIFYTTADSIAEYNLAGHTINYLKFYAKAAGTISISKVKINGSNATNGSSFDYRVTQGITEIELFEPITLSSTNSIGFKGRDILGFNLAGATYGWNWKRVGVTTTYNHYVAIDLGENTNTDLITTNFTTDDLIGHTPIGFIHTDGTWRIGANYNGDFINITSTLKGGTLTVTANELRLSRVAFVKSLPSSTGSSSAINYATGWGVDSTYGATQTISQGETLQLPVPNDANYLYVYLHNVDQDPTGTTDNFPQVLSITHY